jgi:hypothetical protein
MTHEVHESFFSRWPRRVLEDRARARIVAALARRDQPAPEPLPGSAEPRAASPVSKTVLA